MKNTKGFTLIELLIVVAIIGILAAIAIPNFLNAQTRSKVARAEAEMRQIATALETYYIDNNVYPPPADLSDWKLAAPLADVSSDGTFYEASFEQCVSVMLTTPVAHLSTLPTDPFDANGKGAYKYMARKLSCWIMSSYGPDNVASLGDAETDYVDSADVSVGPVTEPCDTRGWREYYTDVAQGGEGIVYDPTNGTTSEGDIVRTGP